MGYISLARQNHRARTDSEEGPMRRTITFALATVVVAALTFGGTASARHVPVNHPHGRTDVAIRVPDRGYGDSILFYSPSVSKNDFTPRSLETWGSMSRSPRGGDGRRCLARISARSGRSCSATLLFPARAARTGWMSPTPLPIHGRARYGVTSGQWHRPRLPRQPRHRTGAGRSTSTPSPTSPVARVPVLPAEPQLLFLGAREVTPR